MSSPARGAADLARLIEPTLVALELPDRIATGFVATPDGRVVTGLHVVAGVTDITVRFADGRRAAVTSVSAVDPLRDIVSLHTDVPVDPAALLDVDPAWVPAHEAPIFSTSGAAMGGTVVETRVSGVQRVSAGLTVFVLGATLPADAAGSPVVAPDGAVAGVLTVARSATGIVMIGVPAAHLARLLSTDDRQPLQSLHAPRLPPADRELPELDPSTLDGAPRDVLEAVARGLIEAIHEGAPAYNRGDIERCWRVYEDAARALVAASREAPMLSATLADAVAEASALDDAASRAWALRDVFDAVLALIEAWFDAAPDEDDETPAARAVGTRGKPN